MREPVGPIVTRPLRLPFLISLGVALGLCGVPRTVAAETPPPVPVESTTTWAVRVADNSRCRDDGVFRGVLEAQIPLSQRVSEEKAELLAEVTVMPGTARIVVFDRVLAAEAGSREIPLSSRRCHKVAEAVSLVLGVLVEAGRGALSNPSAIARADDPAHAAVPLQPPAPEPPPESAPEPLTPSRATRPVRRARPVWRGPPSGHDLSVAAGLGYGLLPSIVPGMTVGWGIRPSGTWPIWLNATGWLESTSSDQRARFSALYAGIMTCPLTRTGERLRARLCPSMAFGALWAESQGFSQTVESRRPLILVGLELAGSVRLVGPLEATLIARAEGVPMRSRFVYRRRDGSEAGIHRPAAVVGSLFAGLALRFR